MESKPQNEQFLARDERITGVKEPALVSFIRLSRSENRT